jgi:uncharacterized protein YjbI with pentapeptide repeats
METEKIQEILEAHKKFVVSEGKEGKKAVLTGAVLTDAVLRGADLRGADLRGAVLRGADLTDAKIYEKDAISLLRILKVELIK